MKTSADSKEIWEENALPSLLKKSKIPFPIPSSHRFATAVQESIVNICCELLSRIPKGWAFPRRLFGLVSTVADETRQAGDVMLSDLVAHHVMAVNSLRAALLSEITTPAVSGIECIGSRVADAFKAEKSARRSIITYEPVDEAEMSAKVLYLMALVFSEGVPLAKDDFDEISRLNSTVH